MFIMSQLYFEKIRINTINITILNVDFSAFVSGRMKNKKNKTLVLIAKPVSCFLHIFNYNIKTNEKRINIMV
jgi:hypothetical protein